MASLKTYYQLAKPGIIYGNAVTALGGFLLASKGRIDFSLLLFMLVGLSLIMGSGCVFNNYLDREIDTRMERTKKRATVTGEVSPRDTLLYGVVLGLIGSLALLRINVQTLELAALGWILYVVVYGYAKRHSIHNTVIGSAAGAIPPVVGYYAVTHRLDSGALILFLILTIWQMPHFYAIALYRYEDYAATKLPILPIVKGEKIAKLHIVAYQVIFLAVIAALTWRGYAGYTYLIVMTLLAAIWLGMGIQGFQASDTSAWARKVFLFSLLILVAFCVTLGLNAYLP